MRAFLRRHRRMLLIVAGALAMYVGSYLALSRRGMAEARAYGYPYHFYVPLEKVTQSEDWQHIHYLLVRIYSPLEEIDRQLGTGKSACRGWTVGLSR
jgi:hypothetical protein